jgi:hypothetical protein
MKSKNTYILTEEEKNKIRLEENYKSELHVKSTEKKSFLDRLDSSSKILQTIAVAVGIFLSLNQYMKNSDSERREAARDYQKSFYQAQMNVYMEVVNSTSILVTADPDSEEYNNARKTFFQLFWGRLSIFENKCVEAKMVLFRMLLLKFEMKDYSSIPYLDPCSNITCNYDTVTQVSLKFTSLQLAHECRVYTIKTWLPKTEQDEYNLKDSAACPSQH